MTKKILIATGIFLFIVVIGVWVYLFLHGAPEGSRTIFGNFGTSGENDFEEGSTETPDDQNTDADEESGRKALRQLTTRPVAGAVFMGDGIRYVERGTGYIYELPLFGGSEMLVSNTTIPQTVEAVFSPDGRGVAIIAEKTRGNETIVARIEDGAALEGKMLPSGSTNVAWDDDNNTVTYLLASQKGAAAYSYDVFGEKSTLLFEIPLRDVRMLWGDTPSMYTTPTAQQIGYAYSVTKNDLDFITHGARGLMMIPYIGGIIITQNNDEGRPVSFSPNTSAQFSFALLPEKCAALENASSTLYCGASRTNAAEAFPDDWYKGVYSFSDLLWNVDASTGENTLLSNLEKESGREIDISKIGTDPDGTYIYFINKNDGTLWFFDTTIASS